MILFIFTQIEEFHSCFPEAAGRRIIAQQLYEVVMSFVLTDVAVNRLDVFLRSFKQLKEVFAVKQQDAGDICFAVFGAGHGNHLLDSL